MNLNMKQTLTLGFALSLDDKTREHLSASLQMSSADLESFLKPQESDYVMIPVRALSATNVQGDTINFGYNNGKALQDAVAMFDGLTILKDHNLSVENWLGATERSYWDTLTPNVPAGVNLMMKVDTKADPKTARGLLSGALNSVSVTIAFDYEKSHPKMNDSEFFMNLGEVVDGTMVQALVTKVTRLYELSVVWQGADKYAKQRVDGRIDVPGTSNSLQENMMDWKKLAATLGLTSLANPDETTVTAALIAQSGELATLKAADYPGQIATLNTTIKTKTDENTALQAKVTELKPNADLGVKFLANRRSEALRLYKLVEGDKATESMTKLINEANLEVAESFVASYQPRAESLAPISCKDCGSKNVNRQASETTTELEDGNLDKNPQAEKLNAARLEKTLARMHSNK